MEITTQFVQTEPNGTADDWRFKKVIENTIIGLTKLFLKKKKLRRRREKCDYVELSRSPYLFPPPMRWTFEMSVVETIQGPRGTT
jgi:putative sigma-54 modulation protein